VPALPAWGEARLALLPLVLWAGLRSGDAAAFRGQALQQQMPQSEMPRLPDAVHALLSLVPSQDQTSLEAPRQHDALLALSLGRRHEFLAPLPVVHEGARVMKPGASAQR